MSTTCRCPNADIVVEGKGFFSSGKWKVRCRACNGQEIASNVAHQLCLSGVGSDFGAGCNLLSHSSRTCNEKDAKWKGCKHASHTYGW